MNTSRIQRESLNDTCLKVVKPSLKKSRNDNNNNIVISTLTPGFKYKNHKGELVIPSSGIK
ncbi:hypothetical protein [Lutibacter citreus]|uniref:hypothetical protein n=1 Tax=Lutibacter citreus TaxID=2138210 RepID=UPI000DBEA213|nr:hypothetical protein [Lutibacter citreus]